METKHELFGVGKTGGNSAGIEQWLAYLLPDPAAPGLNPSIPQKISEFPFSMLLRLINGACKMLIEPI